MQPRAFQIRDFKSIVDSGVCVLSGDNITVLAGQNEAGKTAVLTALRDFDLEEEIEPKTPDYQPDERPSAAPSVSVQFHADPAAIFKGLHEEKLRIPPASRQHLLKHRNLWITRNLQPGTYALEEDFAATWSAAHPSTGAEAGQEADVEAGTAEKLLQPGEFAGWLRSMWPSFIYFDTFQDSLPREVNFSDLVPPKPTTPAPPRLQGTSGFAAILAQPAAANAPPKPTPPRKAPAAVQDFVVMADLDVDCVTALSENDKSLGNYLSQRGAGITGDFLTYWKQRVDGDETVEIRVRGIRDSEGTLKLAFYVHDTSDKYPDQRSKGFLWFLSFYLKLAAAQKRNPERKRLLLIDEPGSYLHARAQRDVLHLFESRISRTDQVIYSTHSPYLMPPERLHRLRIVLKTTQSGTRILDRLTDPALRGKDFADSLSPVIAAIGIDITQSLTLRKEKNVFVEGISDLMYLTAWAATLKPELIEKFNIFPGTGATTIPLLASLFIGWGFKFVALLDNDEQGRSTSGKLKHDLLVSSSRIVHPKDAKTIEDLLSADDFRALLASMNSSLTLNTGEAPSAAIRRQKIDKVLLARAFSERSTQGQTLTKKSQESVGRLLAELVAAWDT